MAYEMDVSYTSMAAKVAELYRDKDKAGGGVGDLFVDAIMRGAYTELHDGTNLGSVPTVFTGSNRLSFYQAAFYGYDQTSGSANDYVGAFNQAAQGGVGLRSLADMVADIRRFLREEGASGVASTEPLRNGADPEIIPAGGVYEALKTIMEHVEQLEEQLDALRERVNELSSS